MTPARDEEILEIDPTMLKIRELEAFEELLGCSFDEAFGPGQPKTKALRALATVVKRRIDPGFSMDDAGDLIVKTVEKGPDPTSASGS